MPWCDIVIRSFIGQRRQLVGPRHTVVAGRLSLWSRRLGLVLYKQRKLDDGPQVVVAVDAGFVELTVQIVLQTADYNMWIHGKDRYEWGIGVCAAGTPE